MKSKKALFIIIICVAAAVLIFCIYQLANYYITADNEENAYDELQVYASVALDDEGGEIIETPQSITDVFKTGYFKDEKYIYDPECNDYYSSLASRDVDAMRETYPDISAWIYIPGTTISYPVLESDGEYYLRRNYKGEHVTSGALFYLSEQSFDPQDDNIIIYGHNMKSGMMFGSLKAFWLVEGMWNDNNYFYLDLPGGKQQIYQMFAMYIDDTTANTVPINFASDEEKLNYFEYIKKKADFYTDVNLSKDDKIITLSTCTHLNNAGNNDRLLIQAKLIDEYYR